MPLPALDPNTALIVIDPQKGVVNGNFIHPIGDIVRRTRASFAEGWTGLPSALDRQPDDIVVTKRSRGAFATTDLESRLKARGVSQVVVTGVVTSGGVEATARQAWEQGFNVTLAIDATTDVREEARQYSVRNVFPRVGETAPAKELISLLERLQEERSAAS